MKELDLGQSDFQNIITGNNYFIDKTLLIEEVIRAQKSVLLLPRPRRFGKTLNLSMLRYFFDNSNPAYKTLFSGLKIETCDAHILKHAGRYPVIYLTFKDAKAVTWGETLNYIKQEIVNVYKDHIYLLERDNLYDFEQTKFRNILNETAKDTDFAGSLFQLSEYLHRFHKQKVVILIDEYDTPIQASHNKFYTQAIAFMRTILSSAFKNNTNLFKGVITGILRVSKESIFTGLNNISVHSILDTRFSDKFGFTEPEVKQILTDFKLSDQFEPLKKWYNGYKFGKSENIYNPWSILSYITESEDGFKTFWSNTSANELIKEQINTKDADSIRADMLQLISQGSIIKDIEENFIFPDLQSDKELIWTLLMYSGYLTTKSKVSDKKYELIIPNYETKRVFQDIIIKWLRVDINIKQSLLEDTCFALVNNKLQTFERGFKSIIGDTFSYFDTAKNHEYVYHAYLLGLLAILGDQYIIRSNKESGEGRYDILLIPHDKTKFGLVIEIKQINKQQQKENAADFSARINDEIKGALAQIERNQYYKELIAHHIKDENILRIPIVFAGKEPFVLISE